jgi:hypothetical protein
LLPAAVALGLAWLWFLWRGRAPGALKRVGLRATLLALVAGLVATASRKGLFQRSSIGFSLSLLLSLLVVTVGYLYLIRFCPTCGRMVRNLKPTRCPRCNALLPRHGMTSMLHRS